MRSTLAPLQLRWEALPPHLFRLLPRLKEELYSWRCTPHRPGQRIRGVGVDCVRFVVCVLESLTGTLSDDVKIPQDASMHSRSAAMKALRGFLESWPEHEDVLHTGFVQPGDIIVVGPNNGGPGHALVVGTQENTLWHASSIGVHMTGWALERPMTKVFRVFRGTTRETWA